MSAEVCAGVSVPTVGPWNTTCRLPVEMDTIQKHQISILLKFLVQVVAVLRTSKKIVWDALAVSTIPWKGSNMSNSHTLLIVGQQHYVNILPTVHFTFEILQRNRRTVNSPTGPVRLCVLSTTCSPPWPPCWLFFYWRRHIQCGVHFNLHCSMFISVRRGSPLFVVHIFLGHVHVFSVLWLILNQVGNIIHDITNSLFRCGTPGRCSTPENGPPYVIDILDIWIEASLV